MGRQKHFIPEDVIDKAIGVFLKKGYEATSVKDLVEATSLHPGSLYNAFGNKKQLFQLALARFDVISQFNRVLDQAETAPPRETIEKLFADLVDPKDGHGAYDSCLISNAAMELGGVDEELTRQLAGYFQKMEDRFCRLIARGQACGDFSSTRGSRQLARLLLSAVQGIQLLSKVNQDREMRWDIADLVLAALHEQAGANSAQGNRGGRTADLM